MSVEAALWVRLGEYRVMDIINVYLRRGFSAFGADNRAYIIVSDDYDWEYLSVSSDEFSDIIAERDRKGLLIGIALYENGEEVTNLLKTTPDELCVSCDINRRTLNDEKRFTDVSWYVGKFIAPLEADGFVFQRFEFSELR